MSASDPKLARRYADGLYDAAKRQNAVSDVMEAMNVLEEVFATAEMRQFWTGYGVPPHKKAEAVHAALSEGPELVRNFLHVLIDKHREAVLYDVVDALRARHDLDAGVLRATLETAIELSDEETAQFVDLLKNRHSGDVELERKVDPELIAGFRLSFGDRIMDASVQRSISEIRRRVSA